MLHLPATVGLIRKYDTIDMSGDTNCSRYVGLSSFMFGAPVEPLKCPNSFMFSFTRCFVNDVTVFHMPPSPVGVPAAESTLCA